VAQGRDPDAADLFSGPPKRKSTAAPYVPLIPPESLPPSGTTELVLTLGEAAARLNVSRAQLEAMIAAGKIEALRMGLTRAIRSRDVERLRAP
jgi:excisionase family DNA binding protein